MPCACIPSFSAPAENYSSHASMLRVASLRGAVISLPSNKKQSSPFPIVTQGSSSSCSVPSISKVSSSLLGGRGKSISLRQSIRCPSAGAGNKSRRPGGSVIIATAAKVTSIHRASEGKGRMGFAEKARDLQDLITASGGAAVVDGGLATELERKGANINDPLWSAKYLIEDPDLIQEVHRDYLESGADVIVSASYQASLPGFAAKGLSKEQGVELLRLSMQIAKKARDVFWQEHQLRKETGTLPQDSARSERRRPLVGASVGPYAGYLADGSEYTGDYGPKIGVKELMEFHRERLQIFAQECPDFLAFETIPCKLEAEAIVVLLNELQLGIPAWLSFNSNDGEHVPSGDPYADCATLADSCDQIVAVGVNCTAPRYIGSMLKIASKVTRKPLVVYPNCGESYNGETKQWVEATGANDEDFSAYTPVWRDAGARLIGGCCRTTPHTIKCIFAALKQHKEGREALSAPVVVI